MDALLALDHALNDLAKLYQFRSLDERLYGALTVSQSYTLRELFFRGPRSMGALAASLGLRLSTMTGVVDQLEARGLIRRFDHPSDRRAFEVRLTPKGEALYRSAHEAFLTHLSPLVRRRSAAERRALVGFLADVVRVVEAWRARPKRKEKRRGS
jgi:DNA-binding MarR family transcriptional regulator